MSKRKKSSKHNKAPKTTSENPVDSKKRPHRLKKFTWIIVGIILGLVLSPLLEPEISWMYTKIGIYEKPNLRVEIFYNQPETESYKIGKVVESYGNITWKDTYEIYAVMIENNGYTLIEDFRMNIYFPGCVLTYVKLPVEGTDYDIIYPGWAKVIINGTEYFPNCYQSIKIFSDELSKEDAIIFEVLIDRNTTGKLIAFPGDTPRYIGNYIWYAGNKWFISNVKFTGEISGNIKTREEVEKQNRR
ncbi:hypothetical protein PAP_06190 [Palaeococcus pacificus DY20341]|uniref:Uncharacterized protein n=1 Tax=Palaeococcus pacificus DY20341 TaxID=1343739 RepID=A0A075LYI5_9EURY|nr:hypothetical protein [Palaeococcus pacificus]AIF69638.1 hypothetical protein PAP_06190 [Palaeococcus pacificus DY20341]